MLHVVCECMRQYWQNKFLVHLANKSNSHSDFLKDCYLAVSFRIKGGVTLSSEKDSLETPAVLGVLT